MKTITCSCLIDVTTGKPLQFQTNLSWWQRFKIRRAARKSARRFKKMLLAND